MKILIDESLPRHLKTMLTAHQTLTVQEAGWAGVRNSELLSRAQAQFDVLLTADKNLRYQQDLKRYTISIIVFPSNRLRIVIALEKSLTRTLSTIEPAEIVELTYP